MTGAEMIAAERQRQITEEGWTPAAAVGSFTQWWPSGWRWKPESDPVRRLAKAGALIAAEIDRRLAEAGQP